MASNPTPSKPPGPFPVPNATVPFWRTELHELDSHRSTAELLSKQDIAIIGAGFAGVTAAHYLQKDASNDTPSSAPSITIFEAREACSGATGRNGGHLRPDPRLGLAARIGPLGLATANEIAAFEYANAEAVAALVAETEAAGEGLTAASCDFRRVTSGDVYVDADQAALMKAQHDELLRLGCPTVEREVTYYGTAEEAERVSGVIGAKAAFTFGAAVMWPYKFVMGLLAIVVRKGANLQTHTPVLAISESADAEGYWTLTTPRGATRARNVLFATNGYTGGVLPLYRDKIIPVRGTCGLVSVSAASANKGGNSSILGSCAPRWAPRLHDYYGVRPDGSLIVGGGWRRMRDGAHEDEYMDVFDDSTQVPCMEGYFEGWAEQTFRGWEDAGTKVDRIWTGIMGDTLDELPHIGRVPSRPGQFICAGFNGHGMPNVLLCAKGVAKVMNEDCAFAETGIPACYETNAERL